MRFCKLFLAAALAEACAPAPASAPEVDAYRPRLRGGPAPHTAPASMVIVPSAPPSTSADVLNCEAREIEQRAQALRVFVQAIRR